MESSNNWLIPIDVRTEDETPFRIVSMECVDALFQVLEICAEEAVKEYDGNVFVVWEIPNNGS